MTNPSPPAGCHHDALVSDQNPFEQVGDVPLDPYMYDTLMARINPELTTWELEVLDQRYKHETPAQAKKRAAGYEKDFAEYDRLAQQELAKMRSCTRTYRRQVIQTAESMDRANEQKRARMSA